MIDGHAPLLLIVEDNDADYAAALRVLRQSSTQRDIERCVHGEDALDYLFGRGDYAGQPPRRPAVILLDLNLPGTDGREVLQEVKQDPALKMIPIVILSTSSNPADIEMSYQHGANSYIVKPVNFTLFADAMKSFDDYWLNVVTLPYR
ncbi:MAG: response regulator [Chloroflexota bacterium]|nr:response regulator [Chloroflexota bacterium]